MTEDIKHTLVFTGITEDESDLFYEDWEGTHIGPESDNMPCGYWEGCGVEQYEEAVVWSGEPRTYKGYRCPHTPTEEESMEGEYFAHGEVHRSINDSFMTFQGCALSTKVDGVADSVSEIFEQHGAGPHEVAVDYWGDEIWDVTKLP